jgi:hypothetical protein
VGEILVKVGNAAEKQHQQQIEPGATNNCFPNKKKGWHF